VSKLWICDFCVIPSIASSSPAQQFQQLINIPRRVLCMNSNHQSLATTRVAAICSESGGDQLALRGAGHALYCKVPR
jgi:hypothetical protein